MFARRHPFLFFISIVSICFTFVFLGFVFFVSSCLKMVNTRFQGYDTEGNIGVVEISGEIVSSGEIIENIKDFRENDSIKAIILRIDSPGGGIGPSQEIYREIIRTKKNKKVIASLGAVAASGGYYIASSASGIVANPGTITGSIGVIMEYANIIEIVRKIGISPVVIKSGEFKDIGSPLKEISERERQLLQELVDELHFQFVNDAAKARGITIETMTELSDGRLYTGRKALNLRLVDRLGNLDDAAEWAGEMAGIEGKLKLVYSRKDDSMILIKRFMGGLLKNFDISGTITDNFRYVIN